MFYTPRGCYTYPNVNTVNENKTKSRKCIFIAFFVCLIIGTVISISIFIYIKKKKESNEEKEKEGVKQEQTGYVYHDRDRDRDEDEEEENTYSDITVEEKARISLLKECMKIYGVTNIPTLERIKYDSPSSMNNKILSISKLEVNINKGETVKIFKSDFELDSGEYACISYEINGKEYMVKIDNGLLYIPTDSNYEVTEAPFTFILYFNYDENFNDIKEIRNLDKEDDNKEIDIYSNKDSNNKIVLRKLSFFSKLKNFAKKNIGTIVEKVVEKTVSFACVSLIKYFFQESYNNVLVKGVSNFACDELGELAGDGAKAITKLVFKSESKPEKNYQEIVYEESVDNNYNTYPINIFSIPYLNNTLNKIKNKEYIEIKGENFTKYSSIIIPPEEILTKYNHIVSPLGNLILAELSSAYLKPVLITDAFDPDIHFFKQYSFEWMYTDEYNKKKDFTNINTFLLDDKYILFNNINCKSQYYSYEFYIAIRKIGESKIKIYKNPTYVYLEKFSDFKAAFWIRDIKHIDSCFRFTGISYAPYDGKHEIDKDWDLLHHYVYAYKKINLAEYDISKMFKFEEFITFTSAENIIMPFYSSNSALIDRFICNNYRLKNINWNEFSIKAGHISQFITYTRLEGIDLDLKFLKGASFLFQFFYFDDLTNNNIKNFDYSQVTTSYFFLENTMGTDLDFLKTLDTSQLNSSDFFITYNNDIIKLDLSSWNKTKLVEMAFGIENCTNLKYVDLSGDVKIKEETDFAGLFYKSDSIEAINIKGWDFSAIEGIDSEDLETSFLFSVMTDTSSIKIYIDENMNYYIDTIKDFFEVYDDDQYTIDPWPY